MLSVLLAIGANNWHYSLFELVSLATEALHLWFEGVHLRDEGAVVLGLALDVDLELALVLRDAHQAALQELKVLVQPETQQHAT